METAVEVSLALATERSVGTKVHIIPTHHLPYTLRVCPIFQISNVTGQGLDLLRTFLNLLPSSEGDPTKFASDQPLEVMLYGVQICAMLFTLSLT